jgi:hypothetical protein
LATKDELVPQNSNHAAQDLPGVVLQEQGKYEVVWQITFMSLRVAEPLRGE